MTSNERKIINCLWETKEKTHIRLIAQKANLSSDYARLLCRSLARSGHIKFENDLAHLLKKGRSRFENNDPVADEPMAVAANVTLLTDEPVVVSPASDRSDEEENPASERRGSLNEIERQEEGVSDDKDDEELDRALADLKPSSQRDEPEEPKDETELQPEPKAEEEKEKETAPEAEMKTKTDTADGKEEAKAENPEKVALKEGPAKSSGGFGISLKKIVNWFAKKK